jgi:hypothetical protein
MSKQTGLSSFLSCWKAAYVGLPSVLFWLSEQPDTSRESVSGIGHFGRHFGRQRLNLIAVGKDKKWLENGPLQRAPLPRGKAMVVHIIVANSFVSLCLSAAAFKRSIAIDMYAAILFIFQGDFLWVAYMS